MTDELRDLMQRYEAAVAETDGAEERRALVARRGMVTPADYQECHRFGASEAAIAREVIDALAARVAELEAAAKWRDPETAPAGERVLTLHKMTFEVARPRYWVGVAEKGADGRWRDDDGSDIDYTGWTVVAWRPLPTPMEVDE